MLIGLECSSMLLLIDDENYFSQGAKLKEKYGFDIINSFDEFKKDSQFFLKYDSAGLSLVNTENTKEAVIADFLSGRSGYRLSTIRNTAQPVLKAIGFNKDKIGLKVIDATAGLGVDGMTMACAGCNVKLLEKSPVMSALLEDAFNRVLEDSEASDLKNVVQKRVQIQNIDSLKYFTDITDNEYDVIYLDPMFPERKKSSKVKKEMQLAKFVTLGEDNALDLLTSALKTSVKRVVIKRPLKAPVLIKGFSSQIKGKSIRFDVFQR